MPVAPKKHPCPDCSYCQWCSDERCALCLKKGDSCRKKLTMAEQIAQYDEVNRRNRLDCRVDETVDLLRDYDLKIIQPATGYRFSLDPLLLCDFAPANRSALLDLGTGCGIIPLVMVRKYPGLAAVGLEIQERMVEIARRNAVNNGLEDRVSIIGGDILDSSTHLATESFDLVMGNPPYRRQGEGKVSPKAGRDLGRHESSATLADFLQTAKRMAKPGGSICFSHHPERLGELFSLAHGLKLSPARLQMVHGDFSLPARIFMIELLKGRKCSLEVLPPVSVKNSPYGERQQAGMRREI